MTQSPTGPVQRGEQNRVSRQVAQYSEPSPWPLHLGAAERALARYLTVFSHTPSGGSRR